MTLPINIRQFRLERGLTVSQLAKIAGVSTPHMSQVERGIKNLNNHLLVRISAALQVAPHDLIAGEVHREAGELGALMQELSAFDRYRVLEFARALKRTQSDMRDPR